MKDKNSRLFIIIVLILLFIIPTYLKYYNGKNLTIKVGIHFSIFESKPWGYFKNVEFCDIQTKKMHHNINIKLYYPDKTNDTRFIIRVIRRTGNNETTINFEIDYDFIYNGIYEGDIYIPIKYSGVHTLSIMLISIENGEEVIFTEQKYRLTRV